MAILIKDNRKYLVADKQIERLTRPDFLTRLGNAWKSLTISFGGTGVPFDQGDTWLRHWHRPAAYASSDPDANAIVMACLFANMEAVCEAPPRVMRKDASGKAEEIPGHPLTQLLEEPNEYIDGALLWMSTAYSFKLNGWAYWLKVRNGMGPVIQLWYEPNATIRPAWNANTPRPGDEFISHYEIFRNNEWLRVKREDVIHFRYGQNPRNTRQGIPTLETAVREVMTDNEAALYSAALLHNTGVPGAVISPKGDIEIDDPEQMKLDYMAKTTGERRGEPLVSQTPLQIDVPAFSPEQMVITALRRIPEERICGLLRTPPQVAGMGVGMEHMIYNNYSEARESFYEGSISPMMRLWARVLTTQVLRKDFGGKANEYVDYDFSDVRVLQDDQNKLAARWSMLYEKGIAKRSEARAEFNLEVGPEDEIYKSGGSASGVPGANGTNNGNGRDGAEALEDLVTVAAGGGE